MFKQIIGTLSVVGYQFYFIGLQFCILGKPHSNFGLFVSLIGGLAALGSLTYSYAFKDRKKKGKEDWKFTCKINDMKYLL